jgi:hypothetical protein
MKLPIPGDSGTINGEESMNVHQWHKDTLGARAVEALKKHDFDAVYFPERARAIEHVLGFVKAGAKVGFGGSMTLSALGIQEKVKAKGAQLLDHNDPSLSAEQKLEIRRQQQVCDLFLTGTNALTLDGCLYNVDGNGNRTNAMSFGPRKVVVVAGTNKICADLEEAERRVKLIAAPMNNKRLNIPNPCTVSGVCEDCQGKTRICKVYSILRRRPSATDISVVIIGEELGY